MRITTTRGDQLELVARGEQLQCLTLKYRNCDEVEAWLAPNKAQLAAFRWLQNCRKLLGPDAALGAICSFGNWPAGWFFKLPQSSIFCRHIYCPSQFCKAGNVLGKCWYNEPPRSEYGCPPSPGLTLPLPGPHHLSPDQTFSLHPPPVKCHTKI